MMRLTKRIGYVFMVVIYFLAIACNGLQNLRNRSTTKDINSKDRNIGIVNVSGSNVEVYWTNPDTKQLHLSSPTPYLKHGDAYEIGSYVGHTFTVKELPSKLGRCIYGEHERACGRAFFSVSANNANKFQAFHIGENLEIEIKDTTATQDTGDIPSGDILDCEAMANEAIGSSKSYDLVETIKLMTKCVEETVTDQMIKASEEIKFQARLRYDLADKLENYTCSDYDLPSSTPLRTEHWHHQNSTLTRQVDILIDRPASRVHVIKNFISPDECAAMDSTAANKLHDATVADGKGGSELSPNRKALQAGIHIPWKKEADGNLLTKISRRVYDYTEHVLKMGITEHGQEDLMSIQYKGRGLKDKEPDRYTPHCDGSCTGSPHRAGQRMATVVMYCTIPEVGGATNFRKSGLHVVPDEGTATFFSYIDPETLLMDNHFTEHSGCPVIEGEKKIVTQWIRYGVDKENPWNSFNTLGIKYKDLQDQS